MKSRRAVSGVVVLALALATVAVGSAGCGGSQRKTPASPAEAAADDPAGSTNSGAPAAQTSAHADTHADWRDDDVPPAPRAHVDQSLCAPAHKVIVVVGRDDAGRPNRWRYFATRHGRRFLSCEAADANGDGKIDARYFYDPSGRLVLEQRDLDFDGTPEVVADYSQFIPRRPVVRARSLQ
jgi:hypothetical protein